MANRKCYECATIFETGQHIAAPLQPPGNETIVKHYSHVIMLHLHIYESACECMAYLELHRTPMQHHSI